MPQLFDIGSRLFVQGQAVATLSLLPIADRAAMVRRIFVTNVSANDAWVLSIGGRELMRFQINTTGNQQLLGAVSTAAPRNHDIFQLYSDMFGTDLSIPVPQGLTLTLASAGGATADIMMEGYEVSPSTINPQMINHYEGSHFVLPVYGFLNAAVAGAAGGSAPLDSMIKPAWVPPIFLSAPLPVGWKIQILALFLEAAGVNTFSGAANHQSRTQALALTRNGQAMLSRAGLGFPLIGAASAAGSANTVFAGTVNPYHAFQNLEDDMLEILGDLPVFAGGDALLWTLFYTGDATGNASYAGALQVALIDLQYTGS